MDQENLSRNSLQGDVEFIDLLARMGCQVAETADGLQIRRDKADRLRGVSVNMSQISDCVPTLAVVAMFAESPTEISGVGFIRSKESDRIGDSANIATTARVGTQSLICDIFTETPRNRSALSRRICNPSAVSAT